MGRRPTPIPYGAGAEGENADLCDHHLHLCLDGGWNKNPKAEDVGMVGRRQ
jgi:hypothetical protein